MSKKDQSHPLKTEKITLNLINKRASYKSQTNQKTHPKNKKNFKRKQQRHPQQNSQQLINYFSFFKPKENRQKIEEKAQQNFKNQIHDQFLEMVQEQPQKSNPKYSNLEIEDIGSQYGDYNYDHELKLVLKKCQKYQKNSENSIPKSKLNCQNFKISSRNNSKFKTEIQSSNYSPANQGSLHSMTEIQTADILKNVQPQQNRRNKTQTNFFINQSKLENKTNSMNTNQINNEKIKQKFFESKFTALRFQNQKVSNQIPYRHHHNRSKTQEELSDKNQSQKPIFQKYEKLKESMRKVSVTHRSQYKKNQNESTMKESSSKEENLRQNQLGNSKQKLHKSYKKYEVVPIFQNIYKMGNSKSGICFTPTASLKDNLEQINLRKLIKARQKNFFHKMYTHGPENSTFTIEQIKSKLQKIQQIQARKNNAHSFSSLNGNASSRANTDLLMYAINQNQPKSKQKQKDIIVKFNGIKFKAKLMKKHKDLYANKNKAATMGGYLSGCLSPKTKRLVI